NISKKLNSALCGTVHRALCEEPGRTQGYISGRTDGNSVVEFKGDESLLGRFINIEIVEFDGILKGKIKE
ncbi:MAG: TRAM domain-containing protein, partial [Oscillospiraceae bacterium]